MPDGPAPRDAHPDLNAKALLVHGRLCDAYGCPVPYFHDLDPLLEVATHTALVGCAQMNAIEIHTWNSTRRSIAKPNRLVFDLDPGEGARWTHVVEAASLVRGVLRELGLEAWLKTSGGKGLHVVCPIAARLEFDVVRDFTRAVVQHLAKTTPSRFVARSGASNRIGRIFVDYLRNGFGATTVSAFSARARPGLGVSMPIDWNAAGDLEGGAQWTVMTALSHWRSMRKDPWAGYWSCSQTLTQARRLLERL